MITAQGFSKGPMLQPEGIVVTLGKVLIDNRGGLRKFVREFMMVMQDDNYIWCHWTRLKPKVECDHVYLVMAGRLWGRCYFGGYRESSGDYPAYIVLAGPFERAPVKRELKGFRGFRYCTKLF